MVRADNKQDSERPRYYSQYWIDVALGKPSVAAVAAPAEDEVEDEDELAFAAPQPEVKPKASKPAEKKPDTGRSTLTSLADLANIDMLMKNSAEMDDTMAPDISAGLSGVEAPGDLTYTDAPEAAEPADSAASSPDDAFEFDEDEDEEDDDWGGSRRKKPGKTKRHEPRREY